MKPTLGLALLVLLVACSDVTTDLVRAPQRSGDAAIDASTRDAASSTDAALDPKSVEACGRGGCECSDGKDNDGDELTDGLDPECTGPYDDDESSFGTGRGSAPAPVSCIDCFWDDNQDSADDGCAYASACRTGDAIEPPGPAAGAAAACLSCDVSPRCVDTCRGRTPNGCDCFGCCDVTRRDGSVVQVLLDEQCSVRDVDDAMRCPRCVKSEQCNNPCGPCELCLGRKRNDLPEECRGDSGGEPVPSCDEGYQVCSETAVCPDEYYCHLGCCLVVPQ